MSIPGYQDAITYALRRLETEVPAHFVYHDIWHTTQDVLPAVIRLGRLASLEDEAIQLLQVGAAFHDLGFIVNQVNHELTGARIAAQILPNYDFDSRRIERIMGLILATRLPQSPRNLMEQILADADLDVLGRDDFLERNELLRREMFANGHRLSTRAWTEEQLQFLRQHEYFTEAARSLRDAGKTRNIALLRARLEAAGQQTS
jgi:uncharacterized protein